MLVRNSRKKQKKTLKACTALLLGHRLSITSFPAHSLRSSDSSCNTSTHTHTHPPAGGLSCLQHGSGQSCPLLRIRSSSSLAKTALGKTGSYWPLGPHSVPTSSTRTIARGPTCWTLESMMRDLREHCTEDEAPISTRGSSGQSATRCAE